MCSIAYGADLEMVRALALLSFSLPLADCRGNTALHYAALVGRAELVDALLLEPTPDEYQLIRAFVEPTGNTEEPQPLAQHSYAQVLCRHRQAVRSLLTSRNNAGETPLYCAVKASHLAATQRLLEMRSDPRIQVCRVCRFSQF